VWIQSPFFSPRCRHSSVDDLPHIFSTPNAFDGCRLTELGDLHGHYPALKRILDGLQERYGVFRASGTDRLRRGVQLAFTGD
jgi:hypothetical protein